MDASSAILGIALQQRPARADVCEAVAKQLIRRYKSSRIQTTQNSVIRGCFCVVEPR
jgi:hypothetical protein